MPVHLTCSQCGGAFRRPPSRADDCCCSRACHAAQRSVSATDRFWPRVDKNGPIPAHCPEVGPCWIWSGSLNPDGYGHMEIGGRRLGAHVAAFILTYGSLPPDKPCVLHKCDGGSIGCVRPSHLFAGTKADNNADMRRKGRVAHGARHGTKTRPERIARGEKHGLSKLTAEVVREIRGRYAAGGVTMLTLASDYGISRPTVSLVLSEKRWSHV